MTHKICLIRGDGTGPEIVSAVEVVLRAAKVDIDWIEVEAGLNATNAKNKTKLEAKADSEAVAASTLSFRIVGQTIDIQALTRFYTQLEASPFIENVVLVKTESVVVQPGNKEAIEFTLDMKLQKADSSFIRRVPLTVAVR